MDRKREKRFQGGIMVTVDDVKILKKQRDKARAELEAANVTIGILNTTIKNLEERVKKAEQSMVGFILG